MTTKISNPQDYVRVEVDRFKAIEAQLIAEADPNKLAQLEEFQQQGKEALRTVLSSDTYQTQRTLYLQETYDDRLGDRYNKRQKEVLTSIASHSKFMDTYQTPEQIFQDYLTPTPIIPGHTLDMQVQGKPIYGHLAIYQKYFTEKFKDDPTFVDKMKSTGLDKRIQDLRAKGLYSVEQSYPTGVDVEDKSVVLGSEPGNDSDSGVDGVTYVRNEGCNCSKAIEKEVRGIIKGLQDTFALTESEAIKLFVLKMGIGKYGWQNSIGRFCRVGSLGWIMFGPASSGGVPSLWFNNDDAGFNSDSVKDALPQLGQGGQNKMAA